MLSNNNNSEIEGLVELVYRMTESDLGGLDLQYRTPEMEQTSFEIEKTTLESLKGSKFERKTMNLLSLRLYK